jgi:antitoxin component of RelBE/YafQ-DinJ toxin-antitoxin module
LEFYDAIKEGDGERILRCWKFLLLHFKADGKGSTKYALEALYLILQVKALLSPRQAYRLLWNRTVRGKDANIPLDLDLEHDNRMAKEAIKKLGRNINEKSVTRIIKAQQTASKMLHSFDKTLSIMRRSGRHTSASDEKDFKKILSKLVEEHALFETEDRKYNHYSVCKTSLLDGLNVHSFYKWTKEHQKNISLHRKSR